jgi:hypothetical protein
MPTEIVLREVYRGITLTVERAEDAITQLDGPPGVGFAVHVPVPGHGYVGRYYATAGEAMTAGGRVVDDYLDKPQPTRTRASSEWIMGMDACMRGLAFALEKTKEQSAADLTLIENEVAAVTDHWSRVRGELPPERPE